MKSIHDELHPTHFGGKNQATFFLGALTYLRMVSLATTQTRVRSDFA
jgi:hypothetical protein